MDNSKTIERWLRQQIFRPREIPLEKIVLRSAGIGAARGSEVESFPLYDGLTGDNLQMLVDEITSRAQTDADGLGNKMQRYLLTARELGKTTDIARLAFRVRGEGGDDNDDGEDPPSEKGLLAQLMRHNEAIMRMNVMTIGNFAMTIAKRNEAAEKRVEDMIAQRFQDLQVLEASKSQQHERDMQMLITSGSEDRKSELFKKLELILPLVVNKIAGKSIMPEGMQGDVFRTLADSLSGDQIGQIAPFLTQEQQVLFLTLLKAAKAPPGAS